MEKKQLWQTVGIVIIIIGLMFVVIGLVKNSINNNPVTTTTTTIPNPEGYKQFIDPVLMLNALPDDAGDFTGGATDTAIQTVTLGQDDVQLRYSIASRKYTSKITGSESYIVITDTLGIKSLGSYFSELVFINTTIGYHAPKIVFGRPAWEIFNYGNVEDSGIGKGLLHVSVGNNRLIVTTNGARAMSPEETRKLAEKVDYALLDALIAGNYSGQ